MAEVAYKGIMFLPSFISTGQLVESLNEETPKTQL
jgi:hypothetical protein